MDADERAMAVLAAEQVIRPGDHPRLCNAVARLHAAGRIVRILPGTYVDATQVDDRLTRYRALQAWAPRTVLWAGSAADLWFQRAPGRLRSGERVIVLHPHPRRPVPWIGWVIGSLDADLVVRRTGVRVASVAATVVELAGRDGGAAIDDALRLRLTTPDELELALAWFRGHRHNGPRQRAVREARRNPWSQGERRVLRLLDEHGIDGWLANPAITVLGSVIRPDVLFPEQRLIIEFDGWASHGGRTAFESDRLRQNRLVLAGYRVLRYTWERLESDPDGVVHEIRRALAAPAA